MVAGVYPLISLSGVCLLSTSLGTQEKQMNRRILVPTLKELIVSDREGRVETWRIYFALKNFFIQV